jgi:catechol 2,3-dioxygenase-like lactoylglutathione lyase family enzyme
MKRAFLITTALMVGFSALPIHSAKPAPVPRPKISGIAFVRLASTDLAVSRAFYENALGFRSGLLACKNMPGLCYMINPSQHVELVQAGSSERGSFLKETAFATDNVSQIREFLIAHGQSPSPIFRGANGLSQLELADPEGNRIAFVESSGVAFQVSELSQISLRLIHAGFVVKDLAAENHFYRDLLGFRLYWRGGFKDQDTDWYEIQVPDGDNWIEYMLNIPANADHKELGVQNHFSLGVKDANSAATQLRKNGLQQFDGPEIGRDGKNSLDAYDPDGTRVEIMEFTPTQKPCCHPYTAEHPKP